MANATGLNQFADSLNLASREHIALVGGGGKTTLLHALGRQLPGSTILTTTTRMGTDQDGGFAVLGPNDNPAAQASQETVLVWSQVEAGVVGASGARAKAVGITTAECDELAALVDYLVVEADGSRLLPFKAPGPLEPVVPATVTRLLSVIGSDALGRVIADQCHRPLRVAALAGCNPYQRLSPAHAATVLLHKNGARRACSAQAQLTVVVTKVDDEVRPLVDELAAELHERESDILVVLVGQLSHPPQTQ